MKHSEFKRKVEELGFELVDERLVTYVVDKNAYLAQVDEECEFFMSSDYDNFSRISPERKQELFDILVEYARTPIEDRRDEKKYSIYPIHTRKQKLIRDDNAFRKYRYENERSFSIDEDEYCTGTRTTVFLEDDAREICDFFGWDFDKVAVEVNDEE